MTDTAPAGRPERELNLRYAGSCRQCDAALSAGTRAVWDSASRTVRCLACPTSGGNPERPPSEPAPDQAHGSEDWGVAGASAQRHYDRQESRRRARLRSRWMMVLLLAGLGALAGAVLATTLGVHPGLFTVLGAVTPVLKVLATPQHIDAWRVGAVGEREVGGRLDRLRSAGVLALHDRRVLGRRTNIDHIAVCPAGVFVIDTKNVAGKVSASRSGLRVGGRRRDTMVHGVLTQVEVVRAALADQPIPAEAVRGVLCFTRAELPWFRASPGGVTLLGLRGLARTVRKPGPLTPEQVQHLAALLAQRLPAA